MDVFKAIAHKMDWLGQRQTVLSQNIANADTPDYQPKDLKEGAFAKLLARRLKPVSPSITQAAHLQGTLPSNRSDTREQDRTYEVAPAGNAVVLEEQLVEVGKTQMDYQLLSNIYKRHMDMMRTALGRGA